MDIRPAEEIWVKGAKGKDVQVFIVKPIQYMLPILHLQNSSYSEG